MPAVPRLAVPDAVASRALAAWRHAWLGPAVRVALALVGVPLVVRTISAQWGQATPPVGIFVIGAVIGTLYALIAMGLILVYRANRIINFASAALGSVPAVFALVLYIDKHIHYLLAVAIAAVGAALLGGLVEVLVVRRFAHSPRLILTVATIGVAQALAYVEFEVPKWVTGEVIEARLPRTPFGGWHFDIGTVRLIGDHVVAVVVVLAIVVALAAFFRFTDIGIAVRASAENADRASLLGIPVKRVSTVVWVLAALLSAIGVFLRAPMVGLPIGGLIGPEVLLYGLAAAVLARMESLSVAFVAGMTIGIIDQGAFFATRTSTLANAVMVLVIFVGLLGQRGALSRAYDTGVATWQTLKEFRPVPTVLRRLPEVVALRVALGALLAAAVVAAPFVVGDDNRGRLTLVVIWAMVGVSLVVLTGWAGQISLGQFAIAGVGAAVAGALATDARGPWNDFFVTLLFAGLAGATIAVVIGLPALRIQGLFLAVSTLAFAFTVQHLLLNRRYASWMLPEQLNYPVARPVLWGRLDVRSDVRFYYLCVVTFFLVVGMARALRRNRSGRVLIGLRDNHRAAQALGVNLARTRLAAFALSGFVAALAGALFAYQTGAVDQLAFTANQSLVVFTMSVLGGLTTLAGAVLGAVFVQSIRYFSTASQSLVTGFGVLVVLLFIPGGLAEVGFRGRDRFLRWVAARRGLHVPSLVADSRQPEVDVLGAERAEAVAARAAAVVGAVDGALLSCRNVEVAYEGVQVLFGVDLDVRPGEIVALLGTNGAGKSTLLRGINGLVDPVGGTITFDGRDITHAGPAETVRLGIVQVPGGRAVFPTLTVAEHLRAAGWLYRDDPEYLARAADEVLTTFPRLRERREQMAGNLSGGEQQMLALGMAFIARPKLLMIDELSLGLAPTIVEQLLEIVRRIRDQGTAIVLVEQSVNVALTVAERAYFLEKGEVRFSGPTADLLDRDDLLRSVFLAGASGGDGNGRARRRKTPLVARARGNGQPEPPVVLDVRGLVKRFGGIRAVDDVDLTVREGEIVGLIGPNGAGKTTLFDLVSGFVLPDAGRVRLDGRDMTTWSPDRRAALGVARSFQDARLFGSLTVAENIALGLERHLPVRDHLASALNLPGVVMLEQDVAWTVHDLVEMVGLGAFRDKLVSELSTGSRRIVDLAMCVAHDPRLLLLDEPSSGIAQRETEALGPLLLRIQRETGCALLVIEHDMPLITSISDEIVALDLGREIVRDVPEAVVTHPEVVASYLGEDPAVIRRSGTSPRRAKAGAGRPR